MHVNITDESKQYFLNDLELLKILYVHIIDVAGRENKSVTEMYNMLIPKHLNGPLVKMLLNKTKTGDYAEKLDYAEKKVNRRRCGPSLICRSGPSSRKQEMRKVGLSLE